MVWSFVVVGVMVMMSFRSDFLFVIFCCSRFWLMA